MKTFISHRWPSKAGQSYESRSSQCSQLTTSGRRLNSISPGSRRQHKPPAQPMASGAHTSPFRGLLACPGSLTRGSPVLREHFPPLSPAAPVELPTICHSSEFLIPSRGSSRSHPHPSRKRQGAPLLKLGQPSRGLVSSETHAKHLWFPGALPATITVPQMVLF